MVRTDQIINIRFYFHIFCALFVSLFALMQFMVITYVVTRLPELNHFFMSKTVCELVLGFKIHQLIPIKLVRTNVTPKIFPVTNLSKRQDYLKITLVNWF